AGDRRRVQLDDRAAGQRHAEQLEHLVGDLVRAIDETVPVGRAGGQRDLRDVASGDQRVVELEGGAAARRHGVQIDAPRGVLTGAVDDRVAVPGDLERDDAAGAADDAAVQFGGRAAGDRDRVQLEAIVHVRVRDEEDPGVVGVELE